MAHIKLYRDAEDIARIEVNGLDLSYEVYGDSFRLTTTGNTEFDEVCVELKIGVSRLDVGDVENVDAALLANLGGARLAMHGDEFEKLVRGAGAKA